MLQVDEEHVMEPELEESDLGGTTQPDNIEGGQHYLSLNALNGCNGASIMHFEGQIQGIPVQILLDSGSSNNFFQPRLA